MSLTFAEKEILVTIDRFPWHGGIQNRDIMAKATTNEHNFNVCAAVLQ